MPTVAVDARDALAPMPRGRGRYVARLAAALRDSPAGDGIELRLLEPPARERGPELLWEQVLLPRVLRRERIDAVHAPNCFLPLRRPCPGVVTVYDLAFEALPDDFSRLTGLKFRTIARRAVRSAERVLCVSEFTRREVCERYGASRDGGRRRGLLRSPRPRRHRGDDPPRARGHRPTRRADRARPAAGGELLVGRDGDGNGGRVPRARRAVRRAG